MRTPSQRFDFSTVKPPDEINAVAAIAVDSEPTPWGPARVAIDALGCRHVLIPAADGAKLRSDRRSAGLQISPRPLDEDGATRLFLDIVCLKPHLFDVFATIAAEMVDAVNRDPREPDTICIRVLDRWRALLASESADAPSLDTLVGLFAELMHVGALATLSPAALRPWTGPDKAVRDFQASKVSLEVKGTLRRAGWQAEIHGIWQLATPPAGDLYLSIWKLELDAANGASVPDLADQIIAAGVDAAELYDRMAKAGVAAAQFGLVRARRFRVLDSRVWKVGPGFPGLVAESFIGGALPLGVEEVRYVLNLTSYGEAHLDEAAVAMLHHGLLDLP